MNDSAYARPGEGFTFRPLAAWAARCLAIHGIEENRHVLRCWINTHLARRDFMGAGGFAHGAADAIAFVGPSILPAVFDVFAGGDCNTRITLAEVIGAIGYLHAPLKAPDYPPADPQTAELAAVILELFRIRYKRDASKVEWLLDLLSHPEADIRHHAGLAVARLYTVGEDAAEQIAIPALRALLCDGVPQVRLAAIRGVAILGQLVAVSDLGQIAGSDPDPQVRREAEQLMARLRTSQL
jgi:hypothetical protein